MSEINIPIAVTGPGTQPAELDGAELDILQLPSGMETYQSPILPEPEEVVALSAAKQRLIDLAERIDGYDRHSGTVATIDLGGLDAANRQLVDQVLGEGEVSIRFEGDIRARIQESVLAGVWRVRYLDADDQVLRDSVEVGEIPSLLVDRAFAGAATCVGDELEDPPEGVLNAPSLLTELNDKVGIYQKGDGSHVINLTLLPQTEQDLAFLDERLGKGNVTLLSRGYGNCRISSTNTRHVWWVQYFNSQDKNILNTLEVTSVPDVACAAPEDIRDSAARLHEILEVYE